MFTAGFALRNLVRNPVRNALSIVAVVAAVWVLIMGQAFIGGLDENIIRAAEDGMSAHVMVRPVDYPTVGMSHPVDELVAVEDELVAVLDAEARAWTERTLFAPTLVFEGDALRVRAVGYDVERDAAVFPRTTWKVQGTPPQSGEDGMLVSTGVADLLGVGIGDSVTVLVRTSAGQQNAVPVPIAGTFTAGNPVLDLLSVFVPSDLTHELVRNPGPSHVFARVDHRSGAADLAMSLAAATGDDVEVRTWVEETEALLELQNIRRTALNFLVFILMGMSATGIANTILMAAYERIREIGTLRAMGMQRGGVIGLFVAEGAFLGVLGGVLGALSAGPLAWYWSVNPIDLSDAIKAQGANMQVSAFLYLSYDQTVIAGAVIFGAVVAMAASVYPALVASRMVPADAVRAA
jgi:putative ABC transport system permease protein